MHSDVCAPERLGSTQIPVTVSPAAAEETPSPNTHSSPSPHCVLSVQPVSVTRSPGTTPRAQ